MLENKEIWDNKDDINKAVESLNQFTHNWCINVKESEEQKDLVFNCSKCEFKTVEGKCLLKVFKKKHLPEFKDFGAMGDF